MRCFTCLFYILSILCSLDTCLSIITPPANSCYLVQGRLSLYLPLTQRRHLSPVDLYNQANSAIKNNMDSGALAECNHDIVKLTYLNDGSVLISNSTDTAANSSGNQKNTFPLTIAWALLGIFGVVLAGIYAKFRYKRYSQRSQSRGHFTAMGDDDNSVEIKDDAIDTPSTSSPVSYGLLDSEWIHFQKASSANNANGISFPSRPDTPGTDDVKDPPLSDDPTDLTILESRIQKVEDKLKVFVEVMK